MTEWASALVIAAITAVVVTPLVEAFALPMAERIVNWWVALYTLGLPNELRQIRTDEIKSDVWEQKSYLTDAGYAPKAIAPHILLRWILGIGGDLLWRFERSGVATRLATEYRHFHAFSAGWWAALVARQH